MKRFLLTLLVSLIFAPLALATYEPLSLANNKFGVHILETSEVEQAAKLVNSQGGDWGYVTIVLRSNDLDRQKWLKFFQDCRKLHLIPIVRLATYPNQDTWVRPDVYDIVDFANFLSDMPWPTKNRYVVLFNEVNRANEWGGSVDAQSYVQMLIAANREFKSRSVDFYLLSAGLDMSAPNSATSMDALDFYRKMTATDLSWNSVVDGLAVHAYPNPGYLSSVYSQTRYGITSYRFEKQLLTYLGYPDKPIFITETGTPFQTNFYQPAFTNVWSDSDIVAITPFLLYSASGDFAGFSLLNPNLTPKTAYTDIFGLSKSAGSPLLSDNLNLQIAPSVSSGPDNSPSANVVISSLWHRIENIFNSIRGLQEIQIGKAKLNVEIADTDSKRAQGLSGRWGMPESVGMLFKFDTPGQHTFWMNDMHFALDFIWIRGGKIVQIDKNIPAPSFSKPFPQIINPKQKIDRVIEVNSGWVDKYGINIGDIVSYEQN